jgi:phage terminase large subunit-like protein
VKTTLESLGPDEAEQLVALAAGQLLRRHASSRRVLEAYQLPPPGNWQYWVFLAGRGAGKTEAGAAYVNAHVLGPPCLAGPVPHRIAIVGPTRRDAGRICVLGESGLLRWNASLAYQPGSERGAELRWHNGAEGVLFGAYTPEDVERFRGPQHCLLWGDEFAAWRYPGEAWHMARLGLRLGEQPRAIFTTTPKPRAALLALLADPQTAVTRARTDDNPHLGATFRNEVHRLFDGSALGRQELDAEIVTEVPGALWTQEVIHRHRVTSHPPLTRVVVAIDPEATSGEGSAETGIIAAGMAADGHCYVLDDATLRGEPFVWGNTAAALFNRVEADWLVVETNNGGEMVEAVLQTIDPEAPVMAVRASRGKYARAEPISALYRRGFVHHVGVFELLEGQLTGWTPSGSERSPDRLDALVWAITALRSTWSEIIVPDEDDYRVHISPY